MHGKSKDSGRQFFMHGGREQRNPPPRFETVKLVEKQEEKGRGKTKTKIEKREIVSLVLERGTRKVANGTGQLEDLSLKGTQVVHAEFVGNPGIFPSDHVTITVTSEGKLKDFTARGDIKGWKPEGGKGNFNLQFSPDVDDKSKKKFYDWRGLSPNALEPIGKKVFRDRRTRPR